MSCTPLLPFLLLLLNFSPISDEGTEARLRNLLKKRDSILGSLVVESILLNSYDEPVHNDVIYPFTSLSVRSSSICFFFFFQIIRLIFFPPWGLKKASPLQRSVRSLPLKETIFLCRRFRPFSFPKWIDLHNPSNDEGIVGGNDLVILEQDHYSYSIPGEYLFCAKYCLNTQNCFLKCVGGAPLLFYN